MVVISGIIAFIGIVIFVAVLGQYFVTYANDSIPDADKPTLGASLVVGGAGFLLCAGIAAVIMFGVPQYHVWEQQKSGEAELAKAEQNRQIAIQEAKAKEESAKSLANARIIEAKGISEANKIIGDSLQNNDAYIHYLWIEALKESNNEVIYIPTEAGIPITESARFFKNRTNMAPDLPAAQPAE